MNATVTDPVTMWASVIPYTATPMTFCSVASLLASVFLNRWVALATTVRQLEARRLDMGINVEKRDPKMYELVQILESRTERGFKQMRLTRVTVAAFNGSIIFFLIASFINGLQALDFNTAKAVPALMIIGAAFLVAGLCVAIAEIIRAVPNQSKKLDEVLEFERSQAPTYNILAAIETTARQYANGATDDDKAKHSTSHLKHKKKIPLDHTIELLEDKEDRKKQKKNH